MTWFIVLRFERISLGDSTVVIPCFACLCQIAVAYVLFLIEGAIIGLDQISYCVLPSVNGHPWGWALSFAGHCTCLQRLGVYNDAPWVHLECGSQGTPLLRTSPLPLGCIPYDHWDVNVVFGI